MVVQPPEKKFSLPNPDISVKMSWNDINSLLKAAGVLQLPEIAFIGNGEHISVNAVDVSNPTCDTFGIHLGETKDNFNIIIKTENLKLLPMDYEISIVKEKGVSEFKGSSVTYYIALDSKSTYSKGK
jgi:hypothetical protein